MVDPGQHYYEAYKTVGGDWTWKVYHYDATGNKEVLVSTSNLARQVTYNRKEDALDAAVEWLEDNGLDADLA